MESIVTGNDMWMHHFTLKEKMTTLRAKKFQVYQSDGKDMASVFWDAKGIIHVEFMPWGITVTHCDNYEAARRKEPGHQSQSLNLQHDSATCWT
jgi:hypothetical protein